MDYYSLLYGAPGHYTYPQGYQYAYHPTRARRPAKYHSQRRSRSRTRQTHDLPHDRREKRTPRDKHGHYQDVQYPRTRSASPFHTRSHANAQAPAPARGRSTTGRRGHESQRAYRYHHSRSRSRSHSRSRSRSRNKKEKSTERRPLPDQSGKHRPYPTSYPTQPRQRGRSSSTGRAFSQGLQGRPQSRDDRGHGKHEPQPRPSGHEHRRQSGARAPRSNGVGGRSKDHQIPVQPPRYRHRGHRSPHIHETPPAPASPPPPPPPLRRKQEAPRKRPGGQNRGRDRSRSRNGDKSRGSHSPSSESEASTVLRYRSRTRDNTAANGAVKARRGRTPSAAPMWTKPRGARENDAIMFGPRGAMRNEGLFEGRRRRRSRERSVRFEV